MSTTTTSIRRRDATTEVHEINLQADFFLVGACLAEDDGVHYWLDASAVPRD